MPRLKYKYPYRADRFYLLTHKQQLRWIMNGSRPHPGETVPDYVDRITLMDAKLTVENARRLAVIFRAAYHGVMAIS